MAQTSASAGVPFLAAWHGPRQAPCHQAEEGLGRYVVGLTAPEGLDQAKHGEICAAALVQVLGPALRELLDRIEYDPENIASEVMSVAEEARKIAGLLGLDPARINVEIAEKDRHAAAAELSQGAPAALDPGPRAQWRIDMQFRANKPDPTLPIIVERLQRGAEKTKAARQGEISAAVEMAHFAELDLVEVARLSASGELNAAAAVMLRNIDVARAFAEVLPSLDLARINREKAKDGGQRWPEPGAAERAVRAAWQKEVVSALCRGALVVIGRHERQGVGIETQSATAPAAEWRRCVVGRHYIELGTLAPRPRLHDALIYRPDDAPPLGNAVAHERWRRRRAEKAAIRWLAAELATSRTQTKKQWQHEARHRADGWPDLTETAWDERVWPEAIELSGVKPKLGAPRKNKLGS